MAHFSKFEKQINDGIYDSITLTNTGDCWTAICFKFDGKVNSQRTHQYKEIIFPDYVREKISLFSSQKKGEMNGTYYIYKSPQALGPHKYINIYF